jgi:hypothetical protein
VLVRELQAEGIVTRTGKPNDKNYFYCLLNYRH